MHVLARDDVGALHPRPAVLAQPLAVRDVDRRARRSVQFEARVAADVAPEVDDDADGAARGQADFRRRDTGGQQRVRVFDRARRERLRRGFSDRDDV